MWRATRFTESLGVRLPIVAALVAGGPTTSKLVAEVSSAGALGVLGCGYQPPEDIRVAIRDLRRRTSAPFGVNLLVPQPFVVDQAQVRSALDLLAPFAAAVGVRLTMPNAFAEDFKAQLEVVLDERVPFFSFTFGIPPGDALAALRDSGIVTCGTATSVAEAEALAAAGVDMVCAQAGEAGGHRGGFLGDPAASSVALVSLVPLICDAVRLPVLAAGGLMDGRGIGAAFTLGAEAAQLGTAFLLCPEAGTSAPYRRVVAGATETDTVLTSAFSGKPARGIRNRMAEQLATTPLPPYPVTNALTRVLRTGPPNKGRWIACRCGQGRGCRWRASCLPASSWQHSSGRSIRRWAASPADGPGRSQRLDRPSRAT